MQTTEQVVAEHWALIDERIDNRVNIAIAAYLANHHAIGANSLPLVLGTPGVPITAAPTKSWMYPKVPFPLLVRECHIIADLVGSMTFDIKVQRPGQIVTAAASIVGGIYPALVAQQEIVIDTAIAGWPNQPTFIEAGSIVSIYVRTSSGVIGQVTVNLGGRGV